MSLASSGDEALARCLTERPDLVLLDVRMPGMSGLECARRLLHSDPSVRIVMLTAGDDPQAVATAVANGAAGYISKDATRLEMGLAIHHVRGNGQRTAEPTPQFKLSERETQVLAGMSAGCPTARSAASRTFRGHDQDPRAPSVPQVARAADRAQAVAVGLRAGLIS